MDPGRLMVLHELAGVEPFHVGDVHRSVRRTCKVKPGGVFPGFDSPTLKSVKYPRGKNDNSSLEFRDYSVYVVIDAWRLPRWGSIYRLP